MCVCLYISKPAHIVMISQIILWLESMYGKQSYAQLQLRSPTRQQTCRGVSGTGNK